MAKRRFTADRRLLAFAPLALRVRPNPVEDSYMVNRKLYFAVALESIGLVSCHNPFGGAYACPAVIKPAIVVEIRDRRSGAPLADDARGAVHDGAYVDSLMPYEGTGSGAGPLLLFSRRAADERPGNYSIEVRHPGYRTWTLSGVRVFTGQCGVRIRRVSASLEPSQ